MCEKNKKSSPNFPGFKEEEVSLGYRRVYKKDKNNNMVDEEVEFKTIRLVPIDIDK